MHLPRVLFVLVIVAGVAVVTGRSTVAFEKVAFNRAYIPGASGANTPPAIKTLDDLVRQPVLATENGWQVRVALSDAGKDAGPWKLLYCLATYSGEDQAPKFTPVEEGPAEPLGPLFFRVDYNGSSAGGAGRRSAAEITCQKELLFCQVVPATVTGTHQFYIFTRTGNTVSQSQWTIGEVAPCLWHRFAETAGKGREGGFRVAVEAPAGRPEFSGVTPLLQREPRWRIDEFALGLNKDLPRRVAWPLEDPFEEAGHPMLPGAVPPAPRWQQACLAGATATQPAARDPITLSLAKGAFVLRSDLELIDDPANHLLARWWVGDKPVLAALTDSEVLRKRDQVKTSKEVQVAFGLPKAAGAMKAGDEVSLQVLYCPQGVRTLLKSATRASLETVDAARAAKGPAWPVLSNKLTFKLTAEMLAEPGSTKPAEP